ncbi:MAG: hypothetical protein RIF41_09220 [Polyangiaceae bacterium]
MKRSPTLSVLVMATAWLSGCASSAPPPSEPGRPHVINLSSDEPILPSLTGWIEGARCDILARDSDTLLVVQCAYDTITLEQIGEQLTYRCRLRRPAGCLTLLERFAPPSPWAWRG